MSRQGGEKAAEKAFKEQKSRESKLTVKPIRFQLEQPKHSLKKTFNIEIRANNVLPLETQIAGHGSENDGQRGLLKHESGFVLKPVQAPPKGEREVAFYHEITASDHPVDQELVQLTARFFGIESVRVQNGVMGLSDYLVLENLTQDLCCPCVMDVKVGARTYGPDASQAKKSQEDAKYQGTKVPFGFSVGGIISQNQGGIKRLHKAFGKSLRRENLHEVLDNFIQLSPSLAKTVARTFLARLEEFSLFFSRQTRYHLFASSLLFVFDYSAADDTEKLVDSVRLKLIDFAHVFPGEGELDENFIFGLNNLCQMFRTFIAKNELKESC